MDPLDQHLIDAGAAWRQSQPEPPSVDRLIAGLDRRAPRAFSPRFAFVLAGALLLLAAVAAAPGVGSFLGGLRGPGVAATASPVATSSCAPASACPSQAPASPGPTEQSSAEPPSAEPPSAQPSGPALATDLVDRYEAALVAGKWQTAFDMLAPASPTRGSGVAAYGAERAPYYVSVAGRYRIGTPTRDVPDWTTYAPLIDGADVSRAYLVEVDYPAMANNNAGYEQFVVAPDASGTWWIWPVR